MPLYRRVRATGTDGLFGTNTPDPTTSPRPVTAYEAFGSHDDADPRTQESGSSADPHRANTKEEDPTGLLNEGFRYRDLEAGVFITRDPLGFVDGPNVYAYVVQNPWSKFDPLGLALKQWFDMARGVADAIPTVKKGKNGRYPINAGYANQRVVPHRLNPKTLERYPDLPKKYPLGVVYNAKGYPIFSPYVIKVGKKAAEVTLEGFTKREDDFRAAWDALLEKGFTKDEIADLKAQD